MPSDIPEVLDEEQARANPELAVLSAMAHGRDDDAERAAHIALVAQKVSCELDDNRSRLYFDLISSSLSEAAREVLKTMDMHNYEYQSEFARRYVAQGRMEGLEQGMERGMEQGRTQGEQAARVALVMRMLAHRFGPVGDPGRERIQKLSADELDAIFERLLSAATLREVLG